MRFLCFLCALFLVSPAFAQDPAETKYKIELPGQTWAYIGNALSLKPYAEAAPILMEMQKQLDAQKPKDPPKDAKK